MRACMGGFENIVKLLIEEKADLNKVDIEGKNCLKLAREENR